MLRRMVVVGAQLAGPSADELARQYHHRLRESPQDLLLADPGPKDMFDDRVYKRGALTLHALRRQLGDEKFFALLRDWTARYRHGTVVTDDFTGLAAKLRARVAAAAVGCVAVLDGCAMTGAGGPYRRRWAGMARPRSTRLTCW